MKTAELTGALLDLWVAKSDPRCNGLTFEDRGDHIVGVADIDGEKVVCIFIHSGNIVDTMRLRRKYDAEHYSPSTVWQNGGPIIDREHGTFTAYFGSGDNLSHYTSDMGVDLNRYRAPGPTHLIAAMRAFVGSKFGAEVPDDRAAAQEADGQRAAIAASRRGDAK
jgi:hypothetical protein